jgi:transposase-like protein
MEKYTMALLKENFNISGLLLDSLDEEMSRRLILKTIYPDGPKCPRCGAIFPALRHGRFYKNQVCRCNSCKRKFCATSETIIASMNISFSELVLIFFLFSLGLRPAEITRRLPRSKDTINRWRKVWANIQ